MPGLHIFLEHQKILYVDLFDSFRLNYPQQDKKPQTLRSYLHS